MTNIVAVSVFTDPTGGDRKVVINPLARYSRRWRLAVLSCNIERVGWIGTPATNQRLRIIDPRAITRPLRARIEQVGVVLRLNRASAACTVPLYARLHHATPAPIR